ncbi:hypothetical protein [Brevibacillus sp. SYSU BS000544]|uniref:hypothetical protein n=1 Tax=Brevibacillus sp. SYSU BS000544 TaxID=3416443 RepID=UPI003CE44C8C
MSRHIEFLGDKLIVHFDGLTSVAALKRELEIPYRAISHVATGAFNIPTLSFRVGTSGIGKNIKHGRFYIDDKKYFVSYQNHNQVVILTLKGYKFDKVALEMTNPEETKELIKKHCPHLVNA